jgi:SAM-dependent methyltransferase
VLQIGGRLGVRLLQCFVPRDDEAGVGAAAANSPISPASLEDDYGAGFLQALQGRTVIDFGSGLGRQAVAMAQAGAARVIGVEIREEALGAAQRAAALAGVQERCVFAPSTNERADIIVSKDAFEHFEQPAQILDTMAGLLKPGGTVLVCFGPPWYHPHGGHFFSMFPWAHLLFTEQALLRWRAAFRSDGARRFGEVSGGLNQMTIARFEAIVAASRFDLAWLDTVPIRSLGFLRWRPFREFGSALVRCRLVLRDPVA